MAETGKYINLGLEKQNPCVLSHMQIQFLNVSIQAEINVTKGLERGRG